MKTKYFLPILFLFISFKFYAQNTFIITYDFGSFGSKDLKAFISKGSWRGAQFEYQYYIKDNISIGILSGFQNFYEKKPISTYVTGTSTLTAVTWRYFQNYPLLLTGKYYFGKNNFKPYLGAGLGLGFSNQEIQIGDYLNSESKTNFAMSAEGGLLYDFNENWGMLFHLKYNYSPYNPSTFSAKNIGYLNAGLGFQFNF